MDVFFYPAENISKLLFAFQNMFSREYRLILYRGLVSVYATVFSAQAQVTAIDDVSRPW